VVSWRLRKSKPHSAGQAADADDEVHIQGLSPMFISSTYINDAQRPPLKSLFDFKLDCL